MIRAAAFASALTASALTASALTACVAGPPPDVATEEAPLGAQVQVLASGLGQPYGLIASGDSLFWIDGDARTLLRMARTGGPVTVLATDADTMSPFSLAADPSYVYWLDDLDGTVRRTPRAGGASVVLAAGQPSEGLVGIATDGLYVYWTSSDAAGGGVVRRVPCAGGPVQTIATGANPTAIVVDPWFVYVADASVLGGNNTIFRVAKGGGAKLVLSTNEDALGLARDGGNLYWKRFWTGDVRRGQTWAPGAVTIAPNGGGWGDLDVDARYVYWTTGPVLHRSAKLGGAPADEVVYTAPSWALSLDVDGDVYLAIERSSEDAPDGQIVRVTP